MRVISYLCRTTPRYFDGFETGSYGVKQATGWLLPGHKYDLDGDGVADTAAQFEDSYFAWNSAFGA